MSICKTTIASIPSLLAYPDRNLALVEETAKGAAELGSRLVVFPELMLTGHGAHRLMADNAESVPDGPIASRILALSDDLGICICVGIAELDRGIVYNSQIVADRGRYLGCQRKIHLSGDEYLFFAPGDSVPVFDIGELRFGISICYDSRFPELSLIHALEGVDAVLSVHAARTGEWPDPPSAEFALEKIRNRQEGWIRRWSGRAEDYNFFVLLCDAVGPSTEDLEDVVANHAGSIMVMAPDGKPVMTTDNKNFVAEIRTYDLDTDLRVRNHNPTRNRRLDVFMNSLRRVERQRSKA